MKIKKGSRRQVFLGILTLTNFLLFFLIAKVIGTWGAGFACGVVGGFVAWSYIVDSRTITIQNKTYGKGKLGEN